MMGSSPIPLYRPRRSLRSSARATVRTRLKSTRPPVSLKSGRVILTKGNYAVSWGNTNWERDTLPPLACSICGRPSGTTAIPIPLGSDGTSNTFVFASEVLQDRPTTSAGRCGRARGAGRGARRSPSSSPRGASAGESGWFHFHVPAHPQPAQGPTGAGPGRRLIHTDPPACFALVNSVQQLMCTP